MTELFRCFGNKPGEELYADYHDHEWGRAVHDDKILFEFLILEGAQAGLSWYTILKRREGYRSAFHHFDPQLVANMTDDELESLRQDDRIIRNRLKIGSARKNARVFLKIQEEFGSFDHFLWSFVDHKQIINHHESYKTIPVKTEVSDRISKELKKRGMSFVGSTIIYAYMQAVGLVDDHLNDCIVRKGLV
ncbi:MAG: DNA-3-methyladenine glycosylase I [Bacilli bacterium]|nr:DNA-3-methyladenine glycosylase I [Bacilli bacterium]MBN2876328.1 DNA-3-methyladenine glycosylase I [Bacilli bacterium]